MPDTVTGFRRVRDRVRARGFVVHEVPHWEGRGAGTLRPAGFLNHHTAGSRSGGNTASLRLVTFGRSDLRNALCNWYCARNGDLYLVAGGVAWHAGRGDLGSNSTLIGCEAENDGLGEPWQPRSLDAQAALNAECAREFGHGSRRCWEHKEHAKGRKIDRAGIDGPSWRHRVEHDSTGTSPTPASPPIEEEDMLIPINVPPGAEQVLWLEPTDGRGFLGTTAGLIVLTTHRPQHPVQIAAPAVGLGWDARTIGNGEPFVHDLRGTKPARLVVRNLDDEWALGGQVMYQR
jgi:hypothetical protein